jgi:hypothetical protein
VERCKPEEAAFRVAFSLVVLRLGGVSVDEIAIADESSMNQGTHPQFVCGGDRR